jgi:predicted aspartyl protease
MKRLAIAAVAAAALFVIGGGHTATTTSDPVVNRACKGDKYAASRCRLGTARDAVPLYTLSDGKAVWIDVTVAGKSLRMLLDTGAMMPQVGRLLAEKIVRDRRGNWAEPVTFVMADGRNVRQRTLLVDVVTIGSHSLRAVQFAVSDGSSVVSFPLINSIAPFKIDTRKSELVFD